MTRLLLLFRAPAAAAPLALLLTALALAGCREPLTAPDPGGDLDPVDPTTDVRSMYVKAPALIVEGETVDVRAEPIEAATHYTWSFSGPGELAISPNDPYGRRRILAAVGVEPGTTLIAARAFDAEGNLLATGSKAVEVLGH